MFTTHYTLSTSGTDPYIEFGVPTGGMDQYVIGSMGTNNHFWGLKVDSINQSGFQMKGMVFDSGSPYIMVPFNDLYKISEWFK